MLRLYELAGRDDRRFSPTCWRVRMALAHKGLAFETVPTPFTGIAEIGGGTSTTVPVLESDGRFVNESTAIARYLEDVFPDRPSLFGGPGGIALCAFVDAWTLATLHQALATFVVRDILDHCAECDVDYFRTSRERRYGRTLEAVVDGREERVETFRGSLLPLRVTLERQPYLHGDGPGYADYIVFGAFQWARSTSPFKVLADDDPVRDYVNGLLDLHGGLGRSTPAYDL